MILKFTYFIIIIITIINFDFDMKELSKSSWFLRHKVIELIESKSHGVNYYVSSLDYLLISVFFSFLLLFIKCCKTTT